MRVGHTLRLIFQADFEFKMKKFEDMTLHELCVECFWMIIYSDNKNKSGISERTNVLVIFFPSMTASFLQLLWSKTMNYSVFVRASVYV